MKARAGIDPVPTPARSGSYECHFKLAVALDIPYDIFLAIRTELTRPNAVRHVISIQDSFFDLSSASSMQIAFSWDRGKQSCPGWPHRVRDETCHYEPILHH